MEAQGMVERVAQAIFDEMEISDGLDLPVAQRYALAAIKAMREPSPRMRHAVAANWGRRTWEQYGEVIDAALNEHQEK